MNESREVYDIFDLATDNREPKMLNYVTKEQREFIMYNKDFLNGIEYLVNNFNIYKNKDYNDENAQC